MKKPPFLLFLLVLSVFVFAQTKTEPIARYSFNHTYTNNDIIPEDVKYVGVTFTEDRFGNPRCAYFLHGDDGSYISLGTSSVLKPVKGTISMWIKMDNPVYSGRGYHNNSFILTKSWNSNDFFEGYGMGYNYDTKKIGVTTTQSELKQVGLTAHDTMTLREWHHVAMTYDDDYLTMYVDGVMENKVAKNFRSRFLFGDSVMVGHSANVKNHRFFNGAVDDIEIYNRVLSPREIIALYNAPDPNRYHIVVKYTITILLSLLVVFAIVVIVTKKYKEELAKEKEKNKLQRIMFEMEVQILKAQMNPHFIFNAINSVQHFILADDTDNAHKYLVKFSRLLRKILESNNEEYIILENEIDILSSYIEIETLRFENAFTYEIVTDAGVNTSKVKIPQMMIQPIVENAIWHGLLPKNGSGHLSIKFTSLSKKLLSCIVDDNGVGRSIKPNKIVVKEKSLALHFIQQRLALMRKEWGGDYSIQITDKVNEQNESIGTQVIITLPIIN